MEIKQIKDKDRIQKFLLQDPYLHLYEIGDLQERLFKNITWYAAEENNEIKALSMLYTSLSGSYEPIFFLVENTNKDAEKQLLEQILAKLPQKIYCHVSKGLSGILKQRYSFEKQYDFIKMKLMGDILVDNCIKYPEFTHRINKNDFEFVRDFLKSVNPNAFFNKAMLDTGKFFCIRKNSDILSMAGVHLYTKEFGVAAIGNVATAEEHRGKGYATSVTASLCRDIWKEVKYIGLNVRADNSNAIKAYEKIGFQKHTEYEEIKAEAKL